MKLFPTKARIKQLALRGTARYGNFLYNLASAARRKSLQKLAEQYPKSFVTPPEKVEAETAHRFGPTLQHVVKDVTGKEPELPRILELIARGMESGLFDNYGEAIFINPHRVDDLLQRLGIQTKSKKQFLEEARKHYLLREYVYHSQAVGFFGSDFRALDRGNYHEREYSILTRDGKKLDITRIVNQDRVKTNDDRPSVLMIPGIACNAKTFDLDNNTSLALEHADQERWVYMFDPRGLGKNKGDFDPQCFFDTLVSNDLPAAVDFLYHRPNPEKPVVIIGHSMGGMIAEFMLIRQSYKLNQILKKLIRLTEDAGFSVKGRTRSEIADFLDKTEAGLGDRRKIRREVKALVAEARNHLAVLNTVKGLITLGSPKIFDKNHHPIYPILLMLNIIFPLLREEDVPVDKGKWLVKLFPKLSSVVRPLINSENFHDVKGFLAQFIGEGTDSFPLGVGFQLLKAIYSGKGVRRMDRFKFNYSAHLDEIPTDIPIFQFIGDQDPLAPPFNLAFIDHSYYQGKTLNFSRFPGYAHKSKGIQELHRFTDPDTVKLSAERAQVQGFVIEGISHLDYFYGKTAERLVRPLLNRLVDIIWQA